MRTAGMGTQEIINKISKLGYTIQRTDDYITVKKPDDSQQRYDSAAEFRAWALDLI